MPLGAFEREVLLQIARNRNPDSFIAGATVLHQSPSSPRALVWAASGKDGGLTPQMILEWTRRQAYYTPEQVKEVQLSSSLDLAQMRQDWMQMTAEAEALFERLPPLEHGCLYLDTAGKPVLPDPASPDFAKLTRHFGSVKGAWPQIADR